MLLHLACSFATVVSEAVSLKFEFWRFLKILYPATCKCFIAFDAVLCIIWTSTIL